MTVHNEIRPATPLEIWRRARGLSREGLGELAGVHRETIARCERRQSMPHGLTMLALAKVLQVSPQDLFPPEGE